MRCVESFHVRNVQKRRTEMKEELIMAKLAAVKVKEDEEEFGRVAEGFLADERAKGHNVKGFGRALVRFAVGI